MKIYLSPSTQGNNDYAVKGTNEKAQMEKIAKKVYYLLSKLSNVKPYLATLSMGIDERPMQAHKLDCDVYLAIHSNSGTGKSTGAVGIYHPKSIPSQRLANKLVYNLNLVCPIKSNRSENIMSGMNSFGGYGFAEIREPMKFDMIPVIIEINFHDNKSTAKYIIKNTDKIASAIVKGITKANLK